MTPETISALVNMGSAGAVIAVVVIFLREMGKRDKQWQDFFTELNKANACDIKDMAIAMKELVAGVSDLATLINSHEDKVNERFERAISAVAKADKIERRKKADGGADHI